MFVSTHSPDFLNGVELDEVFWLVKEDGYAKIKRARDDEQIRKREEEGVGACECYNVALDACCLRRPPRSAWACNFEMLLFFIPVSEFVCQHCNIRTHRPRFPGKPVIKGTRVTVELILRKLSVGLNAEEIVKEHPTITVQDVREAQVYAADLLAGEEIFFAESA